jgi:choline kinase
MRTLIIAAGRGNRLESLTRGEPKCLLRIGNSPLVGFIFASLRKAGISEVVMVTGFQAGSLREAIGDGKKYGVAVRYVHNAQWAKSNGVSVYAARTELSRDETFLLTMSDHLVSPGIVEAVASFVVPSGHVALGIDMRIGEIFDMEDATKVLAEGSAIRRIGKELTEYNGIDCGLFKCTGGLFDALGSILANKDDCSLTDAGLRLAADGKLHAVDVGDNRWLDVDTPAAVEQARKLLRTGELS